jgi:hypothetical protein
MNSMKKQSETFVEALLAGESSAERVRDAFRELGQSIVQSQKSLEEKRTKIEREMKDGARVTKHRFHL